MRKRTLQEEIDNIVLPVLVVIVLFILCGIGFDAYYELNDDCMIKDILAGSYTGKPDGHTNQMLFPLGFVLSKIYLLFSQAPVFGIFFSVCFAGCFVAIGYRSLAYYVNKKVKCAVILLEGALFLSICLWELVYMQYSVVSGLLAAAACFWFYTLPKGLEIKEFLKQGLPSLIFVWLAFLVRSEMLLLMCPYLAAVGIIHWLEEATMQVEEYNGPEKINFKKQIFAKKNVFRYVGFVLLLVLGLGAGFLLDSLAYQTQEWKEFRQFFDARTQVYDYTWYPKYEEAQEFYEANGITKEQYQLLESYNFGLDESINADTLQKIAQYGEKQKMLGSYQVRFRKLVWELVHNMFAKEHAPYNYAVLVSYVLVIGLAVVQKRKDYVWKIGLLLGMRTISWSYLIWSARVVTRISHPLYIIEFLILLAVLVSELYERPLWNMEKYYRRVTAGTYLILIACILPWNCQKVNVEQQRREEIFINQKLLDDYCKSHRENYYYLDVYSSVSFIEKIYKSVDNSKKNYDLLGGWICKSPLQEEARQDYINLNAALRQESQEEENGKSEDIREKIENRSIEDALLLENFFLVIESTADTDFLTDYYKSKGKEVSLELQDAVGEGDNPFLIYKIIEETKADKKKVNNKLRQNKM